MKTLLFLFASVLSAQTTPVNVGTVNVPNEVATAVELWRFQQVASGTTTLLSGITAAATSITVVSAAGINANDQIIIDQEALNVTAKTGNVLTVTRGASITTASVHAAAAVVKVTKWPNLVTLFKMMIRQEVNAVLAQTPTATIQTQIDAKTAADSAINTFLQSTVQ